ncbi:MAG TPA: hypothetical protein DCK95_12290 [Anaerolineaceae bacterium]|uniref:Uncharacterized protein n=1 Tax=Anaerolinea thermophila TaxID=167964 RepID=A0A117LGR8_9CHLR|nr:MAG: hypothetical protein XD73_0786 [Anaerolinea thermophila]HAF63084.1 hypothetical protein [Anaerolineaceae bacterium]
MDMILQYGLLNGFLEVLGTQALHEVLPSQQTSQIVRGNELILKDSLPAYFFSDMNEAMIARYGSAAAQGIAHVAGRLAFQSYKDDIPVLVECGKLENRLLPFAEKITATLRVFLKMLRDQEIADIVVVRNVVHNNWSLEGPVLPTNAPFIQVGEQHSFMGILESLLEWMDSRHAFQVVQKEATSSPQQHNLAFLISVTSFD